LPSRSSQKEAIEVTQIRLLVVVPASEDQRAGEGQQADNASPGGAFTEQANAILRFDGRWQLTMNGMEYPGATEGDTEMTGAADEPPVKEAIEALNRAAVKPDREEGTSGDRDAGRTGAHTEAQVFEFQAPEGRDTIRVRVEPEIVVEDGEQHIRVKVNDPSWVEATGGEGAGTKAGQTSSEPQQAGPEATGSSG
jgi:hypothetical protein